MHCYHTLFFPWQGIPQTQVPDMQQQLPEMQQPTEGNYSQAPSVTFAEIKTLVHYLVSSLEPAGSLPCDSARAFITRQRPCKVLNDRERMSSHS